MEEKNTSTDINKNVLFNLVYAIETAEDFTKEVNIPEDLKENFSRWWDQRKRRTSKRLQKGISNLKGENPFLHLQYGIGIFLLDKSKQAGIDALINQLPEQINEINTEVNRHIAQKSGVGIPHDNPLEVIEHQLSRAYNSRKKIHDLRTAVGFIKQSLYSNHRNQITQLEPDLQNKLAQFLSELRSESAEPLDELIQKIGRLQYVTSNIDNKLPDAYRTNHESSWNQLNQWLVGQEDPNDKESFWVPSDLKTHVTINWIGIAIRTLKDLRKEIAKRKRIVEWCLRWENIESEMYLSEEESKELNNDLKEKDWVQSFVIGAQKSTKSLVNVESIFEYAAAQLEWISDNCEPEEYSSWVEGSRIYFFDSISQNSGINTSAEMELLIKKDEFKKLQALKLYISRRISAIENLRDRLIYILGGIDSRKKTIPEFTLWKDNCKAIISLIRQAKFQEAQEFISKLQGNETQDNVEELEALNSPPESLGFAINYLEVLLSLYNSKDSTQYIENDQISPGIDEIKLTAYEEMLLSEATDKLASLKDEYSNFDTLLRIRDQVEKGFKDAYSGFDAGLEKISNTKKSQKSAARASTIDFFATCQELCPENEEVIGWRPKLGNRAPAPPSKEKWNERYLRGLVCK